MRIKMLLFALVAGVFWMPACDQSETTTTQSQDDEVAATVKQTDAASEAQQPAEQSPPVEQAPPKRIAVGDQAPAFQLRDQNGDEVSLSDLLAAGKVALVFYRSAHW